MSLASLMSSAKLFSCFVVWVVEVVAVERSDGCQTDGRIEWVGVPNPIQSTSHNRHVSTHRWYESSATLPVSPLSVLPGVCEKVSQMEGPRPSVSHAPSIWYAAVAVLVVVV